MLPVIEGARGMLRRSISIDTMKATVAEAAIAAGAHIVNDIRGLQGDPELPKVAARHGAGVIAMHNPGAARLGEADGRRSGRGLPRLLRALARRSPESRHPGGSHRARSGLRIRQVAGAEPRAAGAVLRAERARLSAARRDVAKILHRQGDRARGPGPADRHDRHQRRGGALPEPRSCASTMSPSTSTRCAWRQRSAAPASRGRRLDRCRPRPRR